MLDETFTQLNGLNLYAYCYNNPVMMTDPDGAFALTWWQKLLIGLAFITLGAIATALSGGSFAAAFVCGLSVAVKSAVTGAIVGAVMGGLTSAFSGGNVLEGTASGLMNGLIDGFMWGGIAAGVSNVIKPGSFCFIAGTKVLTDSGQKNIEDIEVGDQVLAYDEETGVTAYKPVLHLFRNTTKEWYHIQAADEEIICTGEHPFYVIGKGFIKASELKRRDKLLNAHAAVALIDSIWVEQLETEQTTYNFEVAEFHTYYVGKVLVLVHNKCVAKDGKYRADVKMGGDPNHPVGHAHIYEGSSEVASVLDDGSVIAGKLKGKAKDFVKAHLQEIKDGIRKYYYIGQKR